MTTKHILVTILLLMVFITSCKEENAMMEHKTDQRKNISFVMGVASNALETAKKEIATIDIYSFRKKSQESEYTLEKVYQNLIPESNGINKSLQIELDGSLERVLYFVANCSVRIPFSPELSIAAFEDLMVYHDNGVPQAPYAMIAKQNIPASMPDTSIAIEFEYALPCLDIDNRYTGFSVDSLVVKGAVCGTKLFMSDPSASNRIKKADINYGNTNRIFLYQTDSSILAVYGKYKGIRAVFDIQLGSIQKATRYKVTFRSMSDSSMDFENNLSWSVTRWSNGETVEYSPDWKQ